MQNFESFFQQLLKAVKTDLTDEFDRNFERKAFFDKRWPETKHSVKRGSLMMRSGATRRGNRSIIQGHSIVFTNSQPQAALHNEGGTITVTGKMKKFFWAMYYSTSSKVKAKRDGNATKATQRYSVDAAYWKSLALMKTGSKITMPERRWIGPHKRVDEIVKKNVDAAVAVLEKELYNTLKNRK